MENKKHIKVKAHPDSDTESVTLIEENCYEIKVKEPAQSGLANKKILNLLYANIEPKPRRLKIVTGYTSTSKTIVVEY